MQRGKCPPRISRPATALFPRRAHPIRELPLCTEKRRPFTATIFMPVETPASNAGRPGQASSTVGDLTSLPDGKHASASVGRRSSNSLALTLMRQRSYAFRKKIAEPRHVDAIERSHSSAVSEGRSTSLTGGRFGLTRIRRSYIIHLEAPIRSAPNR